MPDNKPVLSVCLVNHNAGGLTSDCIRSILEKTSKISYEVILVDNNSTDGDPRRLKERFPDITLLINRRNIGYTAANNQAIRLAKGSFVLLLNNDTLLKNNVLDIMVQLMENDPTIGILSCKLYEPSGKVQKNCRGSYTSPFDTLFGRASFMTRIWPKNPISRRNTLSDWDYNSFRSVDWVSGACLMIRKKVLDQVGLLDERFKMYWEDTDICLRASRAGWRVCFTPEAEILHYTGKGGGQRSLGLELHMICQMHWSAYAYFLKHHFGRPYHPMAVLTLMGMAFLTALKSLKLLGRSFLRR